MGNSTISKICRYILYFLAFAVACVVWDGNTTSVEIKSFLIYVSVIIVLFLSSIIVLRKEKITLRKDPLLFLSAFYGLLLLLSYLHTNRCSINYNTLLPHFIGVVIFILVVHYLSINDLRSILRLLSAAAALCSVYGIMQFFKIDPLPWASRGERFIVISFFGQKNYFALFLLLTLPLTAYLPVIEKKKAARILSASASAVMFAALVLTNSRGAFAAFFLSAYTVILLYVMKRKNSGLKWKRHLVLLIAVPVVILLIGILMPGRMKRDYQKLVQDKQYNVRITFYRAAWEIIQSSPFWGVGPGNFSISYPLNEKFRASTANPNKILEHVHNDFLEIWAEYGLFALLAYLAVVILMARRWAVGFRKSDVKSKELLLLFLVFCSLTGYLFYSLFTVAARYMSSAFYFWFVMGIGDLAIRRSSDRKNEFFEISNPTKRNAALSYTAAAAVVVVLGLLARNTVAFYLSDIHIKRAIVLTKKGNSGLSLELLEKAIRLEPKSVKALYQRAFIYYNNKMYDKALADYETIDMLAHGYGNVVFNMASCYFDKRDWVNAVFMAQRTHKLFPRFQPAPVMCAYCYYLLKQNDKAMKYCNITLKINGRNEKALMLKKALEKQYVIENMKR